MATAKLNAARRNGDCGGHSASVNSSQPYDIMNSVSEPASDVQTCAHCGFSWTALTRAELATRVRRAVEAFVDTMTKAGDDVATRPSEQRWSILEYGGHLRDVLLSIRERVVLASVLDVPVGTPIFRDERVDIGFYAQDTAADVAVELQVVAYLLLKTVATLPARFEERKLIYSDRTPLEITVSGALLNALHECEHHLGDAVEDLALLESSTT
jgi:hypothetical protein